MQTNIVFSPGKLFSGKIVNGPSLEEIREHRVKGTMVSFILKGGERLSLSIEKAILPSEAPPRIFDNASRDDCQITGWIYWTHGGAIVRQWFTMTYYLDRRNGSIHFPEGAVRVG